MRGFIMGHRIKIIFISLLLCTIFPLKADAEATINEKPAFFGAVVNESGQVILSIRQSDYDYYYYNGYGSSGNDNAMPGDEYYNDDYYDEYYYDTYNDTEYPSGYELYRSEQADGEYVLMAGGGLTLSQYGVDVVDQTAAPGMLYYYKARYTALSGETVIYGAFSEIISVTVIPSPGKINSVRATKANTFTIKWNGTANVDGYNIYMKEFDNEYLYSMHEYSRLETDGINIDTYQIPDDVKNMSFTLVDSVSAGTTSMKYDKAKHGMGYIFAIRTYKLVNGNKVESSTMYAAHGVMDYYFCYNAENTKYKYSWPKTEKKARNACKTISVKVWDFTNHAKHSGSKKTRTLYITVNKKYAATVKEIYKEIYKDKSKPPIYEAGSYRWRQEESDWSFHTVGTAIDMNCNENPMYKYEYKKNGKVKKTISVGSFYKPKSNPYSIPRNGVIEKTFAKYGFVRLENDLMHFNAESISTSSNY